MTRTTLIPGQTYHINSLVLAGWTEGDGTGHQDYRLHDYFDATGRYLGPDEHGIEPIAEPDPAYDYCPVCGRPLDEEDRCPMGEDAQHVAQQASEDEPDITDAQIRALREEAAAAGDTAQVVICRIALEGRLDADGVDQLDYEDHTLRAALRDMTQASARAACARAIADARAQEGR